MFNTVNVFVFAFTVQPIFSKQKRAGGEVPITAVEWATRELQRYINFKHHNDLDKKADHVSEICERW